MTRKKFWILIASILVFISVGLVITAVVLQNWALSKLSHSIQHRLDDLQWQIQIEPPSAIPTSACLKTVALHHEQYGDIVLNDVCLDSGMRALFDNSQDLSVSCETIEAAVDWNAINQISQLTQRSTKSSESLPAENSRFHLADRNILAVVKNTHVRLGHKGQMLELRSANDTFEWKNYTAWADLTLSPSLIFKQFPVAFRNLPQIRLVAMANLKQKSANVFVDLVPDISVAYAIDDQVVEVAVHQISAIANLGFCNAFAPQTIG